MYHTYVYEKISQPSYIKELNQKKKAAKKGDTDAQIEYGTACFYGIENGNKQIVKEDPILALNYAKNSANQNKPNGHILYGLMQLYGVGVPKDIPSAFNSFLTANKADPSNLDAQFLLSYLYFQENYKEIDTVTAIQYLTNSGVNDQHHEKQAMFLLGRLYFEGNEISQNYALALRYFSISAEFYSPAQDYLKETTKILTNGYYSLNFNSNPKNIHNSAQKILNENGNNVTPVVEEYLHWAQRRNYPPAMFDVSMLNISRGNVTQRDHEQIEKAAKEFYLPAIDQYVTILLQKKDDINAMMYAKRSIYYKSNVHQTTVAQLYRNEAQKIDPGIYFRYRRHAIQFDAFDNDLINQLKMKAQQNGSPQELYCYAVCLENGFANLQVDVEMAVQLYKKAADKGYEPASRNYAHFLEFGEFVQQDLNGAIKRIEHYSDMEAVSSVRMMKMMLSEDLELPYPYSKKYKKLKSNKCRNPAKSYIKIALLLIRNKLIIPNFKLAEKFANKGKKQFPVGLAVLASIEGDPRAGKPNPSKADKMFKEALQQTNDQEAKDLYAEFLIGEGRENELESLGIVHDEVSLSTRPMTAAQAASTPRPQTGPVILVEGEDLYHEYLTNKDMRLLERSAAAGYGIAQSYYSQYIIKNKMKKQYKLAVSYLKSSSEQGVYTSYVLLGYMYDRGLFVKKDHTEALSNYMLAIEHNEYKGYFGLSLAYSQGKVLDKDLFMAYRYYKIAENIVALYQTPFEFDKYLFADQGCLKAESLMYSIDVNTLKMTNVKDLYLLGFHKEYFEKDFGGAFNCYLEAHKMKPDNVSYKRSLAYFYLKSLGSKGCHQEAIELYNELGNVDDLHNISIAEFYKNNPNTPLYCYNKHSSLIKKINDASASSDELYHFGKMLLEGDEVEQNYLVASFIFSLEQERYNDGKSSRMLAKMIERGYGEAYDKEKIAYQYYRAACNGDGDACYNISKLLANGQGIYVDRVKAVTFMKMAGENGYTVNEDFKEQIINQLTTRKDVFDYCEEFFIYPRKINCPKIILNNVPITNVSYPLSYLTPFPPHSNLPNNEVLFQKGLQYMKGLGVAKNYNLSFKFFAEAILKGCSKSRVYLAVLACITKVSHYQQIYRYNMFKAKLNGHSFAYVEEAKVELGLYENLSPGNKELAIFDLEKAIEAGDLYALYIKGRYLENEEALEEASQNGLGKASYFIGKRYLDMGQISNAIPYLEKAVSQGHNKANYFLGLALLYSKDGNQEQAGSFLSRGANLSGNSNLMVRYGLELLEGDRISKNQSEAVSMFIKAHDMRNIQGTLNLAICLRDGIGIGMDKSQAASLFEIGLQKENPLFYKPASLCFKEMRGFRNWKKAKKCASKAKKVQEAINDSVYVKNEDIINDCDRIEDDNEYNPWMNFQQARNYKMKDLKKYAYHLQVATNLGIFSAIKETILHLFSGLYINEDEDKAYRLLSHMISLGWGTAYKILGDIYYTSDYSFDKSQAYHYYKKAAIMKSKSGMFKYGFALSQGIGCEVDRERGHLFMDKSKCKYAYHYLTKYTSYIPKYAKDVPNCLKSLQNILKETFTDFDVQLAAKKDIKYGIIFYNIHYWKNDRSQLSPMAMVGLKVVANNGSALANFHYGFVHYTLKHYTKATPYLKYAADRKNYTSCHYLGDIFYMDEYFNLQLARKYLSQAAIHLKNAEDAFRMGTITYGDESIKWMDMAINYDPKGYSFKIGLLYSFGNKNIGIEPDKNKAEYIFMKYYKHFTYDQLLKIANSFYNGEPLNQNYKNARQLYKEAADRDDRDNETATKVFIAMCLKGEGGAECVPESYIQRVACSNDPDYKVYALYYAQILMKRERYESALYYLDRADTPEAREVAGHIRAYLEAKRREEEAKRNENGGFLVGAALVLTGLAVAPVATVCTGIALGAVFGGDDSD